MCLVVDECEKLKTHAKTVSTRTTNLHISGDQYPTGKMYTARFNQLYTRF